MVICDPSSPDITSSLEMISKASLLAKQSQSTVGAVCLGIYDNFMYDKLFRHGAHHIVCVQNEFESDDYLAFSSVIGEVIKEHEADLVMFPETTLCKAIAATVSTQLGAGLTADCIDIDLVDGQFIFSRTALNSSVIADIQCINTKYQCCTVKNRVFHDCIHEIEMIDMVENTTGTIEFKEAYPTASIYRALKRIGIESFQKDVVNIASTKIIFAVGRGINREDFYSVGQLAGLVGAEVGGTRIMVENGLIPKSRQIGQSGIHVVPDLYVAFGISGASQHIVGMKSSKTIIAINHDKEAPIFRYADYGIVDDAHNVITSLLSAVEQKV